MRRWFKYGVLVVLAAIIGAGITVLTTEWGLSLTLAIVAAVIPGQLSVGSYQGDLLGPLSLEGIEYRDAYVQVNVSRLELDWRPGKLLNGELHIIDLNLVQTGVRLLDQQETTEAPVSDALPAFSFPLPITIDAARLDNVSIVFDSEQEAIQLQQINLAAQAREQGLAIKTLSVTGYDVQLSSSGKMAFNEHYPLELQTITHYQLAADQQLVSKGNVKGDLKKIQLSQTMTGLIESTVEANVYELLGNLHWDSIVSLSRLNVTELEQALPELDILANINLKGDLKQASLQGIVQINEKGIGQSDLTINSQTDLTTLEYDFSLAGEFIGIDLPESQFHLDGRGDTDQLNISKLTVDLLQGTVQGTGSVRWLPQLILAADLQARNIQTAGLSRQWPGKFNANIKLDTEQKTQQTKYLFSVSEFAGELREFPFQGQANGSWQENVLEVDMLKLVVEKSDLLVQGRLAENWDVKFSAQSPDLRQVLPETTGNFALTGQISGKRMEPEFSLQAQANDIIYGTETVKKLAIQAEAGLSLASPMKIDIAASDIESSLGQWRNVSLIASGTSQSHSIEVNLNNAASKYTASLAGEFQPWQWQGQLAKLDLMLQDLGQWQLQQPVTIIARETQLQFSKLCLLQNTSHLCTELQWTATRQFASLDGQSIPLTLLKYVLPQNIQMTGEVDISSQITGDGQSYRGELKVSAADNAITVNFVDIDERMTLAASEIKLTLNQQALQGRVHLPLRDGGGVDSEIKLPGWSVQQPFARNQPVTAKINIDNLPADTITRFIPDMARAQGSLYTDFEITGTFGEPHLRGQAEWRDGNMIIPDLGITVADIRAEVRSVQSNRIKFEIRARSGDGDVVLAGETVLDPAQGWPTQVNMRSNRLEVVNIPEAYILIDSDVRVVLQGSTINIEGDITVPRARLRPRALPEGSVGLSRDVVIIDEEEVAGETRWLVSSRVRVTLGELVDFDGFGVSGKLRGSLLLIDEPGKLVLGRGEVRIEDGIYRLRGQDLQIRRGRLIFADTFIDDPGIDVDAIREIETVTVGVRLKGTLRQPQLSIFSEPAMSETDALSYLILGHSAASSTTTEAESMRNSAAAMGFFAGDILSQEIGGRLGLDEMRVDVGDTAEKTALVMGKYLSPKLYVRYFSGLVESSSVVQLRYQLSRRIQVQTEGGYRGSQSITGGDIFFTIEY